MANTLDSYPKLNTVHEAKILRMNIKIIFIFLYTSSSKGLIPETFVKGFCGSIVLVTVRSLDTVSMGMLWAQSTNFPGNLEVKEKQYKESGIRLS